MFTGKKLLRSFKFCPLEDAALIAFEADQVISPALLGDVTTGFLLALHRVRGNQATFEAQDVLK